MTGVLVVAAHPDDEVLGAGGTMARHARAGDRVDVLILGEGATSRAEHGDRVGSSATDRLVTQARAAADALGVRSPSFGGLPDNRFDSVDLLDIVKLVESAVDDAQPELVLTHHPGDVNVDHRITFEAVLAATRPIPGSGIREVRSFEIASSSEWAFGSLMPFRPQVFVDVTDFVAVKQQALKCYVDEMRPTPHPRSVQKVADLARFRGAAAGVVAAEAFELIRRIDVDR